MPPKKKVLDQLDQILKTSNLDLTKGGSVPEHIGKDLLHVQVNWNGKRILQDLNLDVEIELSPSALNAALSEQTGRFAWWAMLEVKAKRALNILKRDLKVKRAELMTSLKGADPKMTVEALKAAIDLHPEIESMERQMIELQTDLDGAAVGRKSLRQRKDSLMTISANMRSEMENGLSIRERAKDFFKKKNDD